MDLSIVIPVYQSEDNLLKLVETIKAEIAFVEEYELVLVNDSSPDKSWEKIVELKQQFPFIKGVDLMKNYSQHNAVMAGLHEATGDVVIMMDDDLQHDPSDVKLIYDQITIEQYDVCYTKFTNKFHETWKLWGSRFNDFVAGLLIGKPRNLYLSPFKGMTKQVKDLVIEYKGAYPYLDGLILSVTSKITSIEVEHRHRLIGTGNYTLRKSISLWAKMATGFSVSPLRLAIYSGSVISFLAFLLLVFFILEKLIYNAVPAGWTTLAVLILFFGGVQLLAIGMVGEYLGRIYLNMNSKAQFIVRRKI